MSLPEGQVLISADDHLDIHAMAADVWSSRLPKPWRERGPRVEETPDGPYWFCDGQRISPSGRRSVGDAERRGVACLGTRRDPGERRRRDDDFFRKGADHRAPEDPVTHRGVRDIVRHLDDDAGELAARDERGRNGELVLIGDQQHVGEVHGRGLHADPRVPRTERWRRVVFDPHDLGRAVLVADGGAHVN